MSNHHISHCAKIGAAVIALDASTAATIDAKGA